MSEQDDKFAAGEADDIINSHFFKKFIDKVQKLRNRESLNCETKREDVRYHQGQVAGIKMILGLPTTLRNELRAKTGTHS